MINDAVQQKLNDQINTELYSAYIYLAMSAYANTQSFNGASHWFFLQYKEELTHAEKIYKYILDRDGVVQLKEIKQPALHFENIQQAFSKAYDHERYVTSCLNELSGIAMKENDFTTVTFLQWFLNEQIEEEATVKIIVDNMKLVGTGEGLFLIDRELHQRSTAGESSAD